MRRWLSLDRLRRTAPANGGTSAAEPAIAPEPPSQTGLKDRIRRAGDSLSAAPGRIAEGIKTSMQKAKDLIPARKPQMPVNEPASPPADHGGTTPTDVPAVSGTLPAPRPGFMSRVGQTICKGCENISSAGRAALQKLPRVVKRPAGSTGRNTGEPSRDKGPTLHALLKVWGPVDLGDEATVAGKAPRRGPGFWFAITAILLIAGLAAVDAALFVTDLFERSALLGSAVVALAALATACAAWWIGVEYTALRGMKDAATCRAWARQLEAGNGEPGARDLIGALGRDMGADLAGFDEKHNAPSLPDGELLRLFARTVLKPRDDRASEAVSRAVRQAAVGVAVNPVAMLDGALLLWRSVRMMRDVAAAYGYRPSLAATAYLSRQALNGAASAALIDVVGDVWSAQFTSRLAGVASSKLAEGVFVAVRVARLGIATMELCRPLPFLDSDETPLARLKRKAASWLG